MCLIDKKNKIASPVQPFLNIFDNNRKKNIPMKPVDSSKTLQDLFTSDSRKVKLPGKNPPAKDSIEISNTSKVYNRIDKFLNLGRPDRLDVSDLNNAEREEFLKMLSDLIRKGIVGFEVLEVNGKPEKHYIVNQIGDERLKGAKLYIKKGYYKN
ncbi:hypothetical protein C0389_05085 [bacterium]|nr:hypothetical protein [bacterium]